METLKTYFQVLAATDADADEENVPSDSSLASNAKKVFGKFFCLKHTC